MPLCPLAAFAFLLAKKKKWIFPPMLRSFRVYFLNNFQTCHTTVLTTVFFCVLINLFKTLSPRWPTCDCLESLIAGGSISQGHRYWFPISAFKVVPVTASITVCGWKTHAYLEEPTSNCRHCVYLKVGAKKENRRAFLVSCTPCVTWLITSA